MWTSSTASLSFFIDALGLALSDVWRDEAGHATTGRAPSERFLLRHSGSHHSIILSTPPLSDQGNLVTDTGLLSSPAGATLGWQLSTPAEVDAAKAWIEGRADACSRANISESATQRLFAISDPDGNVNELYFGMERARAELAVPAEFRHAPPLGDIPNEPVNREGVFDVDGFQLRRPFWVTGVGPIGLFVRDVEASAAFYRGLLGLRLTETVEWHGHVCLFLRADTEHHALAIYPIELQAKSAFTASGSKVILGVRLANYRQLLNGARFLRDDIGLLAAAAEPQQLHPGIAFAVHAVHPGGFCLQLYHSMDHLGWAGLPRHPYPPVPANIQQWPEVLTDPT